MFLTSIANHIILVLRCKHVFNLSEPYTMDEDVITNLTLTANQGVSLALAVDDDLTTAAGTPPQCYSYQ